MWIAYITDLVVVFVILSAAYLGRKNRLVFKAIACAATISMIALAIEIHSIV